MRLGSGEKWLRYEQGEQCDERKETAENFSHERGKAEKRGRLDGSGRYRKTYGWDAGAVPFRFNFYNRR